MPAPPPADWQLPPGVNRGLWDYVHDPAIARDYDATLADSALFQADVVFVQKHAGRPGRLIDLGCGTGRLLVPMARGGWWPLGVDLSAEMLAMAAARGAAAGVRVELLRANLTDLGGLADASFDLATCLFSTLGMVVGAPMRRRAVDHVFRLLRPGGRFVLHVHNRWFNAFDPAGRRWLAADLLRQLTGRVPGGDRPMPPHQGIAGLVLHLFTRREVVRLLRDASFRVAVVQPVGLGPDARLPASWWFGWLRAYGYLLVAERP